MTSTQNNAVIVGATSAMAIEVARLMAHDKWGMVLAARSQDKLDVLIADFRIRGASIVESFILDVNEHAKHGDLFAFATAKLGRVDVVFIAHGSLPADAAWESDPDRMIAEMSTNATSVMSLATHACNLLEDRGAGRIVVLSSVAGDRGRRSNYLYGAAKSAVSTFLEGLRARLHGTGVSIVTIKPGFVDTPMTAHVPKNFLFASPARVAKPMYRAIRKGRGVVYVPWFWRWIMLIVRLIPSPIFKRLTL